MIGKVWKLSDDVLSGLNEAYGDEYEGPEDLKKIPELWLACWKKFHHPIYSLCYAINPEYHASKPWEHPEIAADIEKVLKAMYPKLRDRAAVRAALTRYQNKEGCFSPLDEDGVKNDVWDDEFLTSVAPWNWWAEVAKTKENLLFKLCWRSLQIGVASSCNERVFSGWKHIMGDRRTKMSKKRQLDEVYIYTNHRVLKKFKGDAAAECGSVECS